MPSAPWLSRRTLLPNGQEVQLRPTATEVAASPTLDARILPSRLEPALAVRCNSLLGVTLATRCGQQQEGRELREGGQEREHERYEEQAGPVEDDETSGREEQSEA